MLLLFALIVGSVNGAWAETSTLTPSSETLAPSDEHFTVVYGGGGSSTAWNKGGYLRLYAKNTITFTSKNGEKITGIAFTGTVNANSKGSYPTSMSANIGTINPSNITATGEQDFSWTYATGTNEVVLTLGGTAGNIDLTGGSFVVTYSTIPTIVAEDVNIFFNSTKGSIEYTVNNPVAGGALTASTTSDWLTCGAVSASAVAFTTKTNSGSEDRVATVRLTYTYNTDQTATKDVTVTQGILSHEVWVETELDDLTADDVFVIVGNNDKTYALSNDKGTSAAPSAVAVTVANGKLSGTIADNIKWNISGNSTDGYTFYPNGSTKTWLYCTDSNNGVRVGDNTNSTFTVSTEGYLVHGGTSRYVGIYNSADWRCYTSINTNIKDQSFAFYKQVTKESVEVTSVGYATFASDYDLDYRGLDVKAYKASVSGKAIKFTKVDFVPARQGVLLQGAAKTYDVPVITGVAPWDDNAFVRGSGDEVAFDNGNGTYNYVLSTDDKNVVGFYKAAGKKVAKNHAYLQSTYNEARLSFSFDDETGEATGISEVKNVKADAAIYNLNGVRVKNMTKGLYIMNGKKVIVK